MGLARLLEEVAQPEEPRQPVKRAEEGAADSTAAEATPAPDGNAIPEPELVYSGQGLRLWTFSYRPHRLEAQFESFLKPPVKVAGYVPGARKPAEVKPTAVKPSDFSKWPEEGRLYVASESPSGKAQVPSSASGRPVAVRRPAPEERSPESPKARLQPAPAKRSPAPAEAAVRRTDRREDASHIEAKAERPAMSAGRREETPRQEKRAEPAAVPPAGRDGSPKASSGIPAEKQPVEIPFHFGGAVEDSAQDSGRSGGMKIAAGVVLALCLGAGGYIGLGIGGGAGSEKPATATVDSPSWDQWIPNWSATREAGQEGEIALFGPSQEWSDYRVQFTAAGNDELEWVFRASDPRNYYALQITKADSGSLQLVRYAVVAGVRTDEVKAPLKLPSGLSRGVALELEVRGSHFVLFVEGHNVAEWSDERIPVGGFGVVRPDFGLAGVDDVKVTQLNGQSANRGHFWKGMPPDSLPEVTMLPESHKSKQESEKL